MNLTEHLDKGIWTIADKALLLLYGLAVLIVVISVLPENEWGAFYLFQTIFLILCILADSIFLQPMVKFASEHEADVDHVLGASFNLYCGFMLGIGTVLALLSEQAGVLFKSPQLASMLPYLPLLIALNIFRNVGIRWLQVTYRIAGIFWIDLAFFGSIILMAILFHAIGAFGTAKHFLFLNMTGGALSSLVALVFGWKDFRSMPLFSVRSDEYGKLIGFAKFQAGTSVLMTLQQWLDGLIVGVFYSPKEVATYGAAKTIYRMLDAMREGATLLIVPVSSRLYSAGENKNLSALVEKLLFLFFAILVPLSLMLALIADPVFAFFYKGKYQDAVPVFQVLILAGFTLPLTLVATNVLVGIGRAKGLFLSTLGATITFFLLNILLVPPYGEMGAGLAVFGAATVLAILTFLTMRSELDVSAGGILARASEAKQFVQKQSRRIRSDSE